MPINVYVCMYTLNVYIHICALCKCKCIYIYTQTIYKFTNIPTCGLFHPQLSQRKKCGDSKLYFDIPSTIRMEWVRTP